jgi:hypothetical protein
MSSLFGIRSKNSFNQIFYRTNLERHSLGLNSVAFSPEAKYTDWNLRSGIYYICTYLKIT